MSEAPQQQPTFPGRPSTQSQGPRRLLPSNRAAELTAAEAGVLAAEETIAARRDRATR